MSLSSLDLMIVLSMLVIVLGVGYVFRLRVKKSEDLVEAECSVTVGALALAGAALCAPELLAMGAAGARWGLKAAVLPVVTAVPAVLLLAHWIGPWLQRTKSRTIAELLGHRFDSKTRELTAVLFVLLAVFTMGISLRWMADLLRALRVFDLVLRSYGVSAGTIVPVGIVLPALVALICVTFGGLRATAHSRAVLFGVTLAGVLAAIASGWRNQAGPTELHAALAGHGFSAAPAATAVALAVLFGLAYWCADFRAAQFALTLNKSATLRKAGQRAALLAVPVALAAVLAGVVALTLPTPATQSEVREENGVIYHQITVVRPEVEAGKGAVPAAVEARTGKVLRDGAGQATLNWVMAAPGLIGRLPGGLMGLGVAALLAALLSGIVASLSALNTVVNADLLRLKPELEARRLTVQRLVTVVAVMVAVELAFVAKTVDPVAVLVLAFVAVNLPLLAVLTLGGLWKRANGHGAFAGLLLGLVAAAAHHGLTVANGTARGWAGGWLRVAYSYPDGLGQLLATAVTAVIVALLTAAAVSLATGGKKI